MSASAALYAVSRRWLAEDAEPVRAEVRAAETPKPEPEDIEIPAADEVAFEDALELEAPKPSAEKPATQAEEPAAAVPIHATAAAFRDALRSKKYADAVQIGLLIRGGETGDAFRVNLAGALFQAGRIPDAEKELTNLLEQNPYHIQARRNLELVRSSGA